MALSVFRPPLRILPTLPVARTALKALLALWVPLMLAVAPGSASAAPVRTAVVEPSGDGSWRFLSDLAVLWRNRYEPTPEQLATRPMAGALARLQSVNRGRADFAVVDARTAAVHMAGYPHLTALAVLWPTLLHPVTRNPAVSELRLPLPAEVWAVESAGFAYETLAELSRNDPAQEALLSRVPDDVLRDALDFAQEPIVLFTAPAEVRELSEAMGRDRSLRVLPVAGRLLDELKLAHPWLVTENVGRGTYPGQIRNLELPAVYLILVGRRDLPRATVSKVLSTVYGRGNAVAEFDPLFGQTDGRMNEVFGKLMSFHPETARRFNFTPSVP